MSGLDRWLAGVKNAWESSRLQLQRLAPGPGITPGQLHDANASQRWRAVRAIRRHPTPELLPHLIQLSADEDDLVRAAVVDTLASWGPALTLTSVRQALAADPDPESAVALLTLLARLPDAANRSAISSWLQADAPEVRAAAFMALAALCDDADLPQLEEALSQGDIRIQRAILATLCASAAGPVAQRAASASDPILRQRAGQAQPRIQRQLEAKRKAESRTQKQ